MKSKLDLINQAITAKRVLAFEYEGYQREAQPHHSGVLNGKKQLHAYQVAGGSQSEVPVGWKNFEINKIKHLSITDTIFSLRKDHHPFNANYTEIDKSVS